MCGILLSERPYRPKGSLAQVFCSVTNSLGMKTPERGFGSEGTAKTLVLGIPDLMLGETTNKKNGMCFSFDFHLFFFPPQRQYY